MKALAAGFGSVMFDGSLLSYEENIRVSADIARIAHPMGVGLECELGKVGGLEEGGGVKGENVYTNPAQALEFAEKTGVDFPVTNIENLHIFCVTRYAEMIWREITRDTDESRLTRETAAQCLSRLNNV
jgi:fructose/tagatose bisphosphate aldolase